MSEVAAVAALWHRTYFDQQGSEHLPTALARARADLPGCAKALRKKMSDDGFRVLVAMAADGEMGGFAGIKGDGHHAEIDQFFLARKARGTGLAAKLMSAVETKLRGMTSASCRHVFLYVLIGNHRAERFYKRCGFENKGRHTLDIEGVPLVLWKYEKVLS